MLVGELEHATARRAAMALAMATLTARDRGTAQHSDDVLSLCDAIGRRLGFDEQMLELLVAGAQLHDVGKVAMPLAIINKPTALTDGEWAVIREHTVIGERILRAVPEMAEVATVVRHSHEHWDGSGYPDGLRGEEIPLASRVILCADAFHAIRCDRPYRRGRNARAAMAEMKACAGTQFDPQVVDTFAAIREDARGGRVVDADRFRRRRLIALLTTLAIGTGSALAAIPEVREAIKSLFAAGTSPSFAASEPLERPDLRVEPLADALRLPPPERRAQAQRDERPERREPASRAVPATGSNPATRSIPATRANPETQAGQGRRRAPNGEPSAAGRALGRDVPVPRRPGGPPSHPGGRTDPPALGVGAGPNGKGQPPSRSSRERSATR